MPFKKGHTWDTVNKVFVPIVEKEPEVKVSNEEKVIIEKDEMLTKIKNTNSVKEYIEAIWLEYNVHIRNKLYIHFNLTDIKTYWLPWSALWQKVLFEKLQNVSYKEVLQLFNK